MILLATALALQDHDYIYLRNAAAGNDATSLRRLEAMGRIAELSARDWTLKVPFYSRNLREVLNQFNHNHIEPMGKSLLQLDLAGAGDEVALDDKQISQLSVTKKLWQDLNLEEAIAGLPKFAKRTTGLDIFVNEMVQTLKKYKARLERIEATVAAKRAKQPPTARTDKIALG